MSENDQSTPPESTDRPSKIAKFSDETETENAEMAGQNPRSIQRYLIAIEYIGTRFSGAQQQAPNCRTVVGVLQVYTFHLVSTLRIYC